MHDEEVDSLESRQWNSLLVDISLAGSTVSFPVKVCYNYNVMSRAWAYLLSSTTGFFACTPICKLLLSYRGQCLASWGLTRQQLTQHGRRLHSIVTWEWVLETCSQLSSKRSYSWVIQVGSFNGTLPSLSARGNIATRVCRCHCQSSESTSSSWWRSSKANRSSKQWPSVSLLKGNHSKERKTESKRCRFYCYWTWKWLSQVSIYHSCCWSKRSWDQLWCNM